MADFLHKLQKHKDLPVESQKAAGRAIAGKMSPAHEQFLKEVIALIDQGAIDSRKPRSCIKEDVYASMPKPWQAKVDKALPNIVDQLRFIENFYRSKQTPDASPQLETMIAHLWQMKEKIEKEYDVFKF